VVPIGSASPTPPARCCAAAAHSDFSSSVGAAASTATSTGGLRGGKQTYLFLFTREVPRLGAGLPLPLPAAAASANRSIQTEAWQGVTGCPYKSVTAQARPLPLRKPLHVG